MIQSFFDLHCHPSLKPYGQSFKTKPWGQNTTNSRKRNSIWFYDSPNIFEKSIQMFGGIVKFTQADCATLAYGNLRVVCASLYPIEKSFFNNDLGTGALSDLGVNFVTSVSKPRVDYIQSITNYYEDVLREYEYYKQLDGKTISTGAGTYRYIIVRNYQEIESYVSSHPNDADTVFVIMTIEGLHALNPSYDEKAPADEAALIANTIKLKQWSHRPFFVTFTHHFYNHLCGHAQSLTGLVGKIMNQRRGMNEGFSNLGRKVAKELLSTGNGGRILIDVKHMSAAGREEYFAMLQAEFAGENIPVIVSHGAANGLRSRREAVVDGKETGFKLLAHDINFYDEEILMVAKTKGIFGLQLDERRIASDATLKATKHAIALNKIRHYRAELLWNQVRHIAELLNRHDMFAWDCIALGTDYDGIINPLNGFLTAETLPHLQEYLERYVHNYMEGIGKTRMQSYNQISPSEIVNRIFSSNAEEFLRQWFV